MQMRPIIYENQVLEGQRLELTAEDGNYFLGPNLTLRGCTVVIKTTARWFHVSSSSLMDCIVEVKQDLKNFKDWACASLINCRFKGRIPGSDFGRWAGYPGAEDSGIESCDFTEARLDCVRFHACDIRSIRFPPWPCFTILEPFRHATELRSAQWPEHFKSICLDMNGEPSSMVALTYHAPTVAKRYGTTPEALRQTIKTLDFIEH